jgi:hypothetical protein
MLLRMISMVSQMKHRNGMTLIQIVNMNERIKELFEQAHIQPPAIRSGQFAFTPPKTFSPEKFAELIVRECVGVVEGGRFLHDQAPTALFAKECSGAIKRHFGVKE